MAFSVISLEDMCNALGEEKVKEILKEFRCDLNKDVEFFIKEKAIEFLKLGISKTFLVSTEYKSKDVIVGYFALTQKETKIKRNILTYNMRRRLARFVHRSDQKFFAVSLPLIGQLGKNFQNGYNKLITGDELLRLACSKVKEAQNILGGKFVYLECEDKENLINFYQSNGFVNFGKRNLEKDERDKNSGEYLVQMLCDLSNL